MFLPGDDDAEAGVVDEAGNGDEGPDLPSGSR